MVSCQPAGTWALVLSLVSLQLLKREKSKWYVLSPAWAAWCVSSGDAVTAETVTGDFPRHRCHRCPRTTPPPAQGTRWASRSLVDIRLSGPADGSRRMGAAGGWMRGVVCGVSKMQRREGALPAPALGSPGSPRSLRSGHSAALHPPSRPGSGLWLRLGLVTRTDSPAPAPAAPWQPHTPGLSVPLFFLTRVSRVDGGEAMAGSEQLRDAGGPAGAHSDQEGLPKLSQLRPRTCLHTSSSSRSVLALKPPAPLWEQPQLPLAATAPSSCLAWRHRAFGLQPGEPPGLRVTAASRPRPAEAACC